MSLVLFSALILAAIVGLAPSAANAGQQTFSSPEKAVAGLVAAVKAPGDRKLLALFGPGSEALVSSGDEVADREDRKKFLQMYADRHSIERQEGGRAVLLIGKDRYPFPMPIVKKGKRWQFDTTACSNEIVNRRIGENELNAIQVSHAYVDAQREYAFRDGNADGIPDFASRFRSSPGKRDGLYWEPAPGEKESPFGPLVAQAALDGYRTGESDFLSPYHGYLFRILTSQGEGAEGGAYDYLVNGKLLLGFALVAYPAHYGASGIMTFIVNQAGVVYQKDLGEGTDAAVKAMTAFSPDGSWKKLD
jgi:hypothetical protein